MNLLIGIPAYNEEPILAKVLNSLPRKISAISKISVLVVDDGSSDKTALIAEKNGALVARHLLNRGLGGALKTIFEFALDNQYDFLVTMDADGQHQSSDLKKLIKPVIENKTDVSIGSRWLKKGNAPLLRIIINKFANILTFIMFGIFSSDSQSGLRVFNKKSLSKIKIQTDGMEVSSEILREISKNKLKLIEIPISAIYTDYSQKKGQKLENAPNVILQLILRLLR